MSNEKCFSIGGFLCPVDRKHFVRALSFIIRHSVFDILRFSSALTNDGNPTTYSVFRPAHRSVSERLSYHTEQEPIQGICKLNLPASRHAERGWGYFLIASTRSRPKAVNGDLFLKPNLNPDLNPNRFRPQAAWYGASHVST